MLKIAVAQFMSQEMFDMLHTENDKIFMDRPIFVSQEGKVLWVREGRFNWCITDRQEQVSSFLKCSD